MTDTPVCPRHPERVSYVRCQRCERPACPECQRPAPVGVLCVDCLNEARHAQRPVRSRLGFTAAMGTPYITYALMALNIAVFVVAGTVAGPSWVAQFGLWPEYSAELAAIYAGPPGDEWWRWLTSSVVHFNVVHLAMNMFVLWQFGSQLEPALGRVAYGLLYLAGTLGSSAAVLLLGQAPSVHGGASGAIFGLIAAYGVVLYKLKLSYQQVAVTAGIWLVAGFFVPGLSWQGHLGGAIAGAIIMLAMLAWVDRRSPAPHRR